VVHGIVSGHGGAIRVYSEPGRGASFHVLLPRLSVQEAGRSAPEPPSLPGGDERVLVVDDEPDLVEVVSRLLASLGYQVRGFGQSAEALRAFQERPDDFDLVLSDLTMPGLTGLELAQAVRQVRPATPVVICTGFSDSLIQEQARAAAVREVILKPLQRRELALAVRRALDGASTS
jgi:CheY-like chemotaxis protein